MVDYTLRLYYCNIYKCRINTTAFIYNNQIINLLNNRFVNLSWYSRDGIDILSLFTAIISYICRYNIVNNKNIGVRYYSISHVITAFNNRCLVDFLLFRQLCAYL